MSLPPEGGLVGTRAQSSCNAVKMPLALMLEWRAQAAGGFAAAAPPPSPCRRKRLAQSVRVYSWHRPQLFSSSCIVPRHLPYDAAIPKAPSEDGEQQPLSLMQGLDTGPAEVLLGLPVL